MARPKTFDPDQALDRAMDYFWHHGYEATTVRELARHMQIGSSSFYDTFGDKRSVYLTVLKRYIEQEYAQITTHLPQSDSPLALVRDILSGTVSDLLSDDRKRGSFTVNAMIERAAHDDAVRTLIVDSLRRYEIVFREFIAHGQAIGQISTRQPPDVLTDFLLNAFNALHMQARLDPDRQKMENIKRAVLSLFE